MTLVIAGAGMAGVRGQNGYRNLIVAAFGCSLVGDVFLILPSKGATPNAFISRRRQQSLASHPFLRVRL